MTFFLTKNFKVVIIRKFDSVSLKKNHFHLFKSLLYQIGKAENMPLVAGRLVHSPFGAPRVWSARKFKDRAIFKPSHKR